MTTGGFHYHELSLDSYKIFGTDLRLKSSFVLDLNRNANYFGTGEKTVRGKLTDSSGRTYSTMEDYTRDFLEKQVAGEYSNYKYNKYQYLDPNYWADIYGSVTDEVFWVAGVKIAWWDIKSWQGREYEVRGETSSASETLLDRERPDGYDGGFYNTVRFGIAWNTLDYEPDPRRGFNIDYSFETCQRWFGSESAYYRSTLGARQYWPPWKPLTFALRLAYTSAQGDIPFFDMDYFVFPYRRQSGLGGNRTLRGYPLNRFVARTMTLANLEVRYSIFEINPGGQRFEFKVLLFYDAGNAYDHPEGPVTSPRPADYKQCAGAGLVIAWNQATIIHLYYGASAETSAISIDFMHAIQ
jgi:outer membrane protein assembly factor BamA